MSNSATKKAECPECGNHDAAKIEDNGARGEDLTMLCVECGAQWLPNEKKAR